jgi:hypothetical protein
LNARRNLQSKRSQDIPDEPDLEDLSFREKFFAIEALSAIKMDIPRITKTVNCDFHCNSLEEMFTGVRKETSFFRIVGREKNGSLKKRQVKMKVAVEPGVAPGQSMRYENGGNVTTKGPQDICFTVYEV